MRKKIFSALVAVATMCSIVLPTAVSAAGWDNNGNKWNYMFGAHSSLRMSDFSWSPFVVNGSSKSFYVHGGYMGAMIPQFSRDCSYGLNNTARTCVRGGSQGTAVDATVNNGSNAKYSSVAKNGASTKTGWISSWANNSVTYSGYLYMN